MFTRTINTYTAEAFSLTIKDGQAIPEQIGTVEYQATTPSNAAARRAFKQNGITIPRGATIVNNVKDSATYACSMEDFLSVAHRVD